MVWLKLDRLELAGNWDRGCCAVFRFRVRDYLLIKAILFPKIGGVRRGGMMLRRNIPCLFSFCVESEEVAGCVGTLR